MYLVGHDVGKQSKSKGRVPGDRKLKLGIKLQSNYVSSSLFRKTEVEDPTVVKSRQK